jgi:multidrug efflux system membrane fusion protein
MKSLRFTVSLCLVAAAGAGYYWYVQGQPATPAASAEPSSGQSQNGGDRRGGGDQVVSVVTTTAARGDFPIRRHSIGWVEPIATVAVKSRVQSQLLEQNFTDGQMVKEGDLLFTLDDREFQAAVDKDQATLEKDQAVAVRTEADLKRDQQLLARNAGTQQAVDQAVSDEKSAVANVAADQAALETDKLHLSYTKIYAPISGRVGAVTVTPGNLVNANDSGPGFVTITQMQPIRVTFTLPESSLAEIKTAAAGPVPPVVQAIPNGTDKSIAGALDFINSSVDVASGTITVKAEFANQDLSLWPGQYVDVDVDVGMHPNATIVPTVAVQIGQQGSYVFVVKPDQTVDLRNIKTGDTDADRMEVTAGLEPGEKVVTDGQANLANGTRVREGKSASANQPPTADNQGQKS